MASALSEGGKFDEVVDPRLENKFDRQEMERMAASAAAAVRHSAKRRPKMKQVKIENKHCIHILGAINFPNFDSDSCTVSLHNRSSALWRATCRWTT